jgi:hypothetical protein
VSETPQTQNETASTEAPMPDRRDQARMAAYRSRFALVYVGLALVAGIAAGAFLVTVTRDKPADEPVSIPSSLLATNERGEIAAQDLAEAVQRSYRLPTNEPLVNVIASRNSLQDGELGYLRVRYQLIRPVDATFDEDSRPVVLDNAIQYSLCGVERNCAIPGEASAERLMLLRRMGAELALRTLRLDDSVDNVTIFLRPVQPPGNADSYVLLFERDQLEQNLLSKPLGDVLPGIGVQLVPGQMTQAQQTKVDELTRRNLYVGIYQLLGGRDALLQLQPVQPG